MTRTSLLVCAVCASLAGCNQGPGAPYPVWAEPETPYVAGSITGNAFDAYLSASVAAVKAAPTEADRVSFLSGMKTAALKKLSVVLKSVNRASRLPSTFEYRAVDAFATDPNAKGWRLIGRALVWKIEANIEAKDFAEAAHWTVVATKFGLDLTQGDAQTATLGFTICNDARKAFAPACEQLTAEQSTALSSGLATILAKYPGLSHTVANEKKRMLLGVQFVQDSREKGDYETLQRKLGRDAKQAITYLKNLGEPNRPTYFESLANAVKSFADHWETDIDKPRPDRMAWVGPEGSNVYIKFAQAFNGTIEPLASIADTCLARTRLLAITARAIGRAKSTGQAPRNLQGLAKSVTLDPYSGSDLVYNASGPDFHVYSVGVNNRDDGRETDDAGESPDLVLEGPDL